MSQVGHRIVGQYYHRVRVDVCAEVPSVEVVLVQMRDIQVVAVAQSVPVQPAVVREREPGCEVGRIHPWVAQNAASMGLDQKAGVADTRDLHKYLSGDFSGRVELSLTCRTGLARQWLFPTSGGSQPVALR